MSYVVAFGFHLAQSSTRRQRRTWIACATGERPAPPLRSGRISHAVVLEQAAMAVRAHGGKRLTVDFPPEKNERDSGTLVRRYENNLNFAERLLSKLTDGGAQLPIGGKVNIRDNINPQGGGEYLDDDECITGVCSGDFAVVLNAGVDASTLRKLNEIDAGTVVLVNGALERLSWFDKRGLRGAIDDYIPAYVCRIVAGRGILLFAAPHSWTAYVPRADGTFAVAFESNEQPKMAQVEAAVRRAADEERVKSKR